MSANGVYVHVAYLKRVLRIAAKEVFGVEASETQIQQKLDAWHKEARLPVNHALKEERILSNRVPVQTVDCKAA